MNCEFVFVFVFLCCFVTGRYCFECFGVAIAVHTKKYVKLTKRIYYDAIATIATIAPITINNNPISIDFKNAMCSIQANKVDKNIAEIPSIIINILFVEKQNKLIKLKLEHISARDF